VPTPAAGAAGAAQAGKERVESGAAGKAAGAVPRESGANRHPLEGPAGTRSRRKRGRHLLFRLLRRPERPPSAHHDLGRQIEYSSTFSTTDIVYLSGGEAEGVKAGQDYFIVQPVRKLRHPATNAVLGLVIRYVGHARVLCTQDHSATAEILASVRRHPLGALVETVRAPFPSR